ncbi:uncharacterized protein LOC144643408 isoform X1 [Oculina patagonica]
MFIELICHPILLYKIMDMFSRTSLEAHNKLRSAHNVPPLSWSNELARGAQIWAKKLAKEGGLKHDQLKGIGENVFMASQGFDAAAEEATKTWYSEVERYDFKTGGHQPGTGHFTQVVWKNSKELGMARAKSSDGSVYVVARYRPAGNDLNAFNGNVLPKVSTGEEHQMPEKSSPQQEDLIKMKDFSIPKDSFIDAVLKAHNDLRILHGVPSLKWSPALSKDAQAWAEKLSRNSELRHASKEERKFKGENICRMSNHYDVSDAVKIWYSEINSYKYNSPGFSIDTGHFTQIVWRDTTEVGVGTCKSRDGRLMYIVARYNPAGNVLERFHENVLKTNS